MATYYVRPDGNNSNAGTGQATNQAWQTIQYALRVGSPVTGGDIIYIAPGRYYELVTVGISTPSSEVQILGDPTCQQFTGLTAGIIRWTNLPSDSTGNQSNAALTNTVPNLTFKFIYFDIWARYALSLVSNGGNAVFENCIFSIGGANSQASFSVTSAYPNLRFNNNTFFGNATIGFGSSAGTFDSNYYVYNNIFIFVGQTNTITLSSTANGGVFYNNTILGGELGSTSTNATNPWKAYNNYIWGGLATPLRTNTVGGLVGDYNRSATEGGVYQYVPGANDQISYMASQSSLGLDRLFNIGTNEFLAPYTNAAITNAGQPDSTAVAITAGTAQIPQGGVVYKVGDSMVFTSTVGNLVAGTIFKVATVTSTTSFTITGITPSVSGTVIHRRVRPTTDIYNAPNQFTDVGNKGALVKYSLSTIGQYNPTERNSSAITIVPGSTSQSIELYLGVTGLTASTSGLSATFNRTRSLAVPITLVSLSLMTDGWVSGGFKEVNASTMPGVYRLDLPDAALAAGADDVTVVVKGAAGTNGAVMTIKLQSVANEILSADIGGGTNAGTLNERTVRSALRAMRNKVSVGTGTMSVYKEDDSAVAWTGLLSNTADVTVDPV
jgi:hypothetical protein